MSRAFGIKIAIICRQHPLTGAFGWFDSPCHAALHQDCAVSRLSGLFAVGYDDAGEAAVADDTPALGDGDLPIHLKTPRPLLRQFGGIGDDGVGEVGSGQIGSGQVSPGQVGTSQIGSSHVGI